MSGKNLVMRKFSIEIWISKSVKVAATKDSLGRLVLPDILGAQRVWQAENSKLMGFSILKVRNLLLCSVSRGPLTLHYSSLTRIVCGIDQPGSIKLAVTEFNFAKTKTNTRN